MELVQYPESPEKRGKVIFVTVELVVIAVILFLVTTINVYMMKKYQQMIFYQLRLQLFRSILQKSLSFFTANHENSVCKLLLVLEREVPRLSSLSGELIDNVASLFGTLVVGFVIGFMGNYKLTILILGFLPFLGAFAYVYGRFGTLVEARFLEKLEASNVFFYESLDQLELILSYNLEVRFYKKYEDKLRKAYSKKFIVKLVGTEVFYLT